MKFIIKKEISKNGTWYWTRPKNLFLRFVHGFIWFFCLRDESLAYGLSDTREGAIKHIKRYNSGWYKKEYYSEVVEDDVE